MPSKVVIYKGACAALIPMTSTAASALAVAMKDFPEWQFGLLLAVVALNSFNAAASGLSSFLSRTFADHEDEKASKA